MSTFSTKKILYGSASLIPEIAVQIKDAFVRDGYEVRYEALSSGGYDISITKGGFFKTVLGMKTALKVSLLPGDGDIMFEAGIGIWGQQVIPLVISMFFFWPVLLTQSWGLAQQAKLDDKALEIAERVVYAKGASSCGATAVSADPVPSVSDGVRFCTSDDKDARVSMLMQAWAVLADVGGAEKLASAMKAVEENCLTQFGPTLYAPPYLEERPGIGRESAKRPGCGENGSCYTHGAMMLAAAEFKFNHPEIAMDITRKVMSPPPPELYSIRRASPLWWANYFQSPYAAQPGRSSNIISSGAPAWFSINLLEEVLGIQPTLDGLRIAPRLPAEWKGAEVERIWRGVRYRIVIRRGSRNSIRLDGAEINGDLLPVPGTGETTHQVEVETA